MSLVFDAVEYCYLVLHLLMHLSEFELNVVGILRNKPVLCLVFLKKMFELNACTICLGRTHLEN